jgi:hypothetical protein
MDESKLRKAILKIADKHIVDRRNNVLRLHTFMSNNDELIAFSKALLKSKQKEIKNV